jgi:4-diphosphocytidyl-2-C-methyl-D-erythritol kinase
MHLTTGILIIVRSDTTCEIYRYSPYTSSFNIFALIFRLMILFPNAKINLGLQVIRKRADGYHDIQSVFLPVPLKDALEAIHAPDGEFSFTCSGLPIPENTEANLCVRAYRLLQQHHRIGPVHMHLHKVIPLEAGLGGGSADAAFALKLLSALFALDLGELQLLHYATQLGSDCAFFIMNTPAMAEGRGELLSPVKPDLSGYTLVIVKPQISVSTVEAYAIAKPAEPAINLKNILEQGVHSWKGQVINDFEPEIFKKHPEMLDIKNKLYATGAIYASMSGSGSAIYGIFSDAPALSFPSCFYWETRL